MDHVMIILDWASRVLRGALLTGALLLGLAICATIVLWQVDFYSVRDRYEHVRAALFGPWQSQHWCPPGRVSEACEVATDFTDALAEASDFTFFRETDIAGTSLQITTGIRFATALDVIGGRPAKQWCYLNVPDGPTSRRIDVASKEGPELPVYPDLRDLSLPVLRERGLSAAELMRLAPSHCRFDP